MDNFQWDESDFEGLVKDNKCFSAINSVYQAVKKFKNENGHPISYLQFKTLQNESQEINQQPATDTQANLTTNTQQTFTENFSNQPSDVSAQFSPIQNDCKK
jgi:hypothetical protein